MAQKNGNFPFGSLECLVFLAYIQLFVFFDLLDKISNFLSQDWRKDRPIAPTFIEDVGGSK